MQWVVISSLISLSLGLTLREVEDFKEGEGDEEQPRKEYALPANCCKAQDVLPSVFKQSAETCMKNFVESQTQSEATGEQGAPPVFCMVQCILEMNHLLKDGKIDETATRMAFIKEADRKTRRVLRLALDKCFKQFSSFGVHETICNSGTQELFGCIMSEVVIHCPNSMWVDSPECSSAKDRLREIEIER